VIRRVLLLLLAVACTGGGERAPAADGAGAGGNTGTGAPPELYRGTMNTADDAASFTPCGGDAAITLHDGTGGDLRGAYQSLAGMPGTPMFVEFMGRATGDGVEAVALRHAAIETPGCDDPRREGLAFLVTGSEPTWSLRLATDGIELTEPGAVAPLVFPWVEPRPDGRALVIVTAAPGPPPHALEARLVEERCTDTMSGALFPFTAFATVDGRALQGCAIEGTP